MRRGNPCTNPLCVFFRGGCSPSLVGTRCGVVGIFQSTKKLVLSEQAGRGQALEFLRKNAANGLSVANLLAGLSSILCSVNRWGKLGKTA